MKAKKHFGDTCCISRHSSVFHLFYTTLAARHPNEGFIFLTLSDTSLLMKLVCTVNSPLNVGHRAHHSGDKKKNPHQRRHHWIGNGHFTYATIWPHYFETILFQRSHHTLWDNNNKSCYNYDSLNKKKSSKIHALAAFMHIRIINHKY